MCLCEYILWNQYTENFEEPFHLKVPGFFPRIKKKKSLISYFPELSLFFISGTPIIWVLHL